MFPTQTRRQFLRTVIVTPLALSILSSLPPVGLLGAASGIGNWYSTGALATARTRHAAVALADGRVLVAGGSGGGILKSAALYDPGLGAWVPTGDLNVARVGHSMTLLANGTVLVVGGSDGSIFDTPLSSAEIYNPATGQWTLASPMNTIHRSHTATRLADGRVLIVGRNNNPAQAAEIFNPATSTWTITTPMLLPRGGAAAALLANGMVLVTGGFGGGEEALASSELYDPATNQWTTTGNLLVGRRNHTITPLPDGRLLVAAGADGGSSALASTEIYSPQSATWVAAPPLATRRFGHTATALLDGRVLVAGGRDNTGGNDATLDSAEIYDATTNTWSLASSMAHLRANHVAVRLAQGRTLVIGGVSGQLAPLASVEVFDPSATAPTYPLTLNTVGPGSATLSPPGAEYLAGAIVTAIANAAPGGLFVGWTRNGARAGWPAHLAITMSGAQQVTATFVAPPAFSDLPSGDPAWVAVAHLAVRGIVNGYGDGSFGPTDTTLRAQMAAFICRANGWDAEDWGNPFTDRGNFDADLWRNVGTLAHYGVAVGYGDGSFGPGDPVLRVQTIALITRALVIRGYWQAQADNPALFANVPMTSGHRQELATYAHFAGPLPDEVNTEYFANWDQPGTRGWFARALWRALDRTFGQ